MASILSRANRSYIEVNLARSPVQIIRNHRTAVDKPKTSIAFQRDRAMGGMDIGGSIRGAGRLRHPSAESGASDISASDISAGHCRSIKRSFAGYCRRSARDREKISAAD
jgi:hypothetical protein